MKKIKIQIDEDVYNALIAFSVLNLTDSIDLCLAEIMFDATLGQAGEEFYGNACRSAEMLVTKKRKQYASGNAKNGE